MTTDPRALTGTTVAGGYHVERALGEGAAAIVFLAHDLRHDNVKVLGGRGGGERLPEV